MLKLTILYMVLMVLFSTVLRNTFFIFIDSGFYLSTEILLTTKNKTKERTRNLVLER